MKNTKLIALVAVLVVITMIISIVVATSADKKLRDEANKNAQNANTQIDSLQQTIDKLNQTITDLQNGIKDAEEVAKEQAELIEQLKQWGIEIENWNEATAVLMEKLAELDKKVDEYENAKDENGNTVLNKADYSFLGWDTVAGNFVGNAQKDLVRATSVEEMDKIIADCLANIKAIKTNIEVLYDTVAAIEADGVTADDKDNVLKVLNGQWLSDAVISLDKYEGETVKERTATKAELVKRWNEALKSYKTAAAEKYVAMVNALPELDAVKVTDFFKYDTENKVYVQDDESAIAATYVQYNHLVNDLGLSFTKNNDPVVKAHKAADALKARATELKALKVWADEFNANIGAEAFFSNFGLNVDTIKQIVFYEGFVADKLTAWEEQLDTVLDPAKAGFNEYVYNFIDHATLEGYRNDYDALAADLKTAADAYIEAVENIYAQVEFADIDAANTAADGVFKALKAVKGLTKNTNVATIDILLGNEENEVATAAKDHAEIATELGEIKIAIGKIDKHVHETILSLKHVAGCKLDATCTCTEKVYNSNLNYTTITSVLNKWFYPIVTTERNFTEDILGAELLADLKAAYTTAAKAHVVASVEAWAAANAGNEGFELQVVNMIKTLYCVDLDEVVFSATYVEPTYDVEGNELTSGYWRWSDETQAYFNTVADYCNTALYNDIYEGLVNP